MKYIYKAMRYHAPVEDKFDSLREAVQRARSDWDTDQAWPVEITDESGNVIVGGDAIIAVAEGDVRLLSKLL